MARCLLWLTPAVVSACAPFQHYRAVPAPASDSSALTYWTRALDNPALGQFLTQAGTPPSDTVWLAHQLALVALYYRPDLAVARGDVARARAAVISAGARPPVGVSGSAEEAARPEEGNPSRWSAELTADFTLETAGKRGARIARAQASAMAALLTLETAGWEIASEAATAASAVVAADSTASATIVVVATLDSVAGHVHGRYAAGEIGSAEVARSVMDLAEARQAVAEANRARTTTREMLAQTLGVPVGAVATTVIKTGPSACGILDSMHVDTLAHRALRLRTSVGVALATYAEAQASLRLVIAEQYPDINIGPAFLWDQGIARWIVAIGLPDLVLSRNRGPIAEAMAYRAMEAARVTAVQDSVLSEVDVAAAECQSARLDRVAADSLMGAAEQTLAVTRRAYDRGEAGGTDVALAALGVARFEIARSDARGRELIAGAALEQASGMWFTTPALVWPDLTRSPTVAQARS